MNLFHDLHTLTFPEGVPLSYGADNCRHTTTKCMQIKRNPLLGRFLKQQCRDFSNCNSHPLSQPAISWLTAMLMFVYGQASKLNQNVREYQGCQSMLPYILSPPSITSLNWKLETIFPWQYTSHYAGLHVFSIVTLFAC